MINYISTRGEAPILPFSEAVLTGLARDGGLYLPQEIPTLSPRDIRALRGKPYTQIAKFVLWPYLEGEMERRVFEDMVEKAYESFQHDAVCPLIQTRPNEFILELFHGPTLAFKDFAMQLLSRLMHYFLKKTNKRATIIGATSGDTGGAAIEAFGKTEEIDVFILFPKGKVSALQQKQMTCHDKKNIHVIAIDGNFDDCQTLVKALFNDSDFREKTALSGVNSINWARIMAQIVYYFSAGISLGAPDRAISFTVPTGNFGDIFAGFIASRMGLPIAQLVIASNDNDILPRTLETGIYQIRKLISTTSPSMDIQISSNFERLLFEVNDRNGTIIRNLMANLKQSAQFTLEDIALQKIKAIFSAGRSTTAETAEMIKNLYEQSHYLADPHTAVALKVAREHMQNHIPMVVLSTAHPAKFLDAVYEASGVMPKLPARLEKLVHKEEHFSSLPNDEQILKKFILDRI